MDLETVEVVNRRDAQEEAMFDGQVIAFEPHGKRQLPRQVGLCIVNQSAMQIDMATGLATQHRFGITGHPEWPTDPLGGEFAKDQPVEALDRTNIAESTVGETAILEDHLDKKIIKKKADPGRYEARVTGIPEPRGSQAGSTEHLTIK